jgi:hypothetical protein
LREIDPLQSTAPDGTPRILRSIIFVIPPLLVSKLFRDGHWALFFTSFIPGALFVALWPPRTDTSLRAGIAAVAAFVLAVVAHFADWK